MIAVDTNVVVRFLVTDDRVQSRAVERLLERLERRRQQAIVPVIVVCETVWVLASVYGHSRGEIVTAVRQLLLIPQFEFTARDAILAAVDAYELGKGDFADYLIREHAKAAGCDGVATFDKRLLKEAMFVAP